MTSSLDVRGLPGRPPLLITRLVALLFLVPPPLLLLLPIADASQVAFPWLSDQVLVFGLCLGLALGFAGLVRLWQLDHVRRGRVRMTQPGVRILRKGTYAKAGWDEIASYETYRDRIALHLYREFPRRQDDQGVLEWLNELMGWLPVWLKRRPLWVPVVSEEAKVAVLGFLDERSIMRR